YHSRIREGRHMTRRLIAGSILFLMALMPFARGEGAAALDKRLHDTFAFLRDFVWWTDNDPWANAIFTMIDSGKPGLPVLLEEICDTDSARLQRTIPI